MTSTPSFNLIEQPWIRVRTIDGDVAERSLRNVLVKSPRLRSPAEKIGAHRVAEDEWVKDLQPFEYLIL